MSYPLGTLIDTGKRHISTGDPLVRFSDDPTQTIYFERHGVVGCSMEQLDSITCLRQAISVGIDANLALISQRGSVISAPSLPHPSTHFVTVAAWDGQGWCVRKDGSIFRSPYRWSIDTDYNITRIEN